MKERFTRRSRLGRGSIPRDMRNEIYKRDDLTCQYCHVQYPLNELTIDHLVPLSRGGLDEMPNYVTCCHKCNERKSNIPLEDFSKSMKIEITELPVHGDPIIDNEQLPIQIRLLRKSLFDKYRQGRLRLSGQNAQKKLELSYRRHFWLTPEGISLEAEFSKLPGHARIMIPEIRTIAKSTREFLLLVELTKSANTRNLIGTVLTSECDVEGRVASLINRTKNQALKKRLERAVLRFESEAHKRMLS